MKHVFLLISAMFLLTATSCNEQQPGTSVTYQNINQEEFLQLQQQANTIVIDVRTPGEIAQGFIKGTSVFADYNAGQFETVMQQLDTSKTYLVYCRSGARSSNAAQLMIEHGIKKVYNLEGGINGWTGEIVKPE